MDVAHDFQGRRQKWFQKVLDELPGRPQELSKTALKAARSIPRAAQEVNKDAKRSSFSVGLWGVLREAPGIHFGAISDSPGSIVDSTPDRFSSQFQPYSRGHLLFSLGCCCHLVCFLVFFIHFLQVFLLVFA